MKLYILEVESADYGIVRLEDRYQIKDFDNNDVLFDTVGSYPSHRITIPLDNSEDTCNAELITYDLGDMSIPYKNKVKSALCFVYNTLYDESRTVDHDLFFRFSDEWQPNVEKDENDERMYAVMKFDN